MVRIAAHGVASAALLRALEHHLNIPGRLPRLAPFDLRGPGSLLDHLLRFDLLPITHGRDRQVLPCTSLVALFPSGFGHGPQPSSPLWPRSRCFQCGAAKTATCQCARAYLPHKQDACSGADCIQAGNARRSGASIRFCTSPATAYQRAGPHFCRDVTERCSCLWAVASPIAVQKKSESEDSLLRFVRHLEDVPASLGCL